MISDCRIRNLFEDVKKGDTLKSAATKAGISFKTAKKYHDLGKLPTQIRPLHNWKNYNDPFSDVWSWVEEELQHNPEKGAKEIFQSLQKKFSRQFDDKLLRTFQRRVKKWKLSREENASDWLKRLLSGRLPPYEIESKISKINNKETIDVLISNAIHGNLRHRNRAISILLYLKPLSPIQIAKVTMLNPKTVRGYIARFEEGGTDKLFCFNRKKQKKYEMKEYTDKLFSILHAPPSSFDINRTTWKMTDIKKIMETQNLPISLSTIRKIIRSAGYKWRKAKTVLTSNDPEYKEKLDHIKAILSQLGNNDRFCSTDEFGPFAIKMKAGRKLVGPNEYPMVPQFQKSKGCLILTAGLELSRNQVTHFYSKKKNTKEMVKLLKRLLKKYRGCNKLYLSWDAASWHASHMLYDKVNEVNADEYRAIENTPIVELAPLPASAQFLNVIESVFSGMARAVIHNSNYASVKDAKNAINRYFRERNAFFRKHPKRAGNKIWGDELVPCNFSDSQNCKDPKWR